MDPTFLSPPSSSSMTAGGKKDFSTLLSSSSNLVSSLATQPRFGVASNGDGGNVGVVGGGSLPSNPSAASTTMPTHHQPSTKTTPMIQRSFRELQAASSTLASRGSSSSAGTSSWGGPSSYASEASAHRLLARDGGGFDSASLGRDARKLRLTDVSASAQSPFRSSLVGGTPSDAAPSGTGGGQTSPGTATSDPGLSSSSLPEYLHRHHMNSIHSILERHHHRVEQQREAVLEQRLMQDFHEEVEQTTKDFVGGRYLGGLTGGAAADEQKYSDPMAALGPPVYGDGSGSGAFFQPQDASSLSSLAKDHVATLASFNTRTKSVTSSSSKAMPPHALMSEFQTLTEAYLSAVSPAADAKTTTMMRSYLDAWKLIQCMFQETDSAYMDEDQAIQSRVLGTLFRLCQQYRQYIQSAVKSLSVVVTGGAAAVSGGASLSQDVARFVDLQHWNNGPDRGLWARVYCCLRCGDACAALETLESSSAVEINASVLHVIRLLAGRQAPTQSIFDATHKTTTSSSTEEGARRRDIAELYRTTQTRIPSENHGNPYFTTVLALLSLSEVPQSPQIVRTIEDYLFASLWMVLFREQQKQASSLVVGGEITTCASDVAELGTVVKQWGPSYFEGSDDPANNSVTSHTPPDAGGWAYAAPLLATQQYRSALSHLASVGGLLGLLQATHLCIALQFAGCPSLRDVGDEAKDGTDEDSLAISLLISYSSAFRQTDPKSSLEYLVCLPGNRSVNARSGGGGIILGPIAQEQICKLILETRAFETFAGALGNDGSRQGTGALDAYLRRSDVSSILADAADECVNATRRTTTSTGTTGGNMADAAELLSLAGRYSTLLNLINRELSSLLIANDVENEQRRFWRTAAHRFYELHFAGGRTHVVEVLEQEGNSALGSTFQLFLNLMVFFDRCHSGQWKDAWALVDGLDLFPQSESNVPLKVESFQSLDMTVKQTFHHITLNSMEALYQQHGLLKSRLEKETSEMASGTMIQRLAELRERARLLMTFVGLIHLNQPASSAQMARMEAYMV